VAVVRPVGERSDERWRQLLVGHAAAAVRKRAPAVERTAWGWMLHAPALPRVWALNRAQIVPGAGGLAPDAVVADVLEHHRRRGLSHVAADVRADGDVPALAPALARAGLVVAALEVLVADPATLADEAAARPGVAVAVEDPEAARGLRHAASADLPEPERTEVAAQWSPGGDPQTLHLLARDGADTPVGAAVLHLARLHVELDDVLTHPDHRRAGVGTAIVGAAAAIARDRGVGAVGLLSDPGSPAARWYRRLGFVPVGPAVSAVRAAAG
jgi:GNAT superfamily N-acetyltransferase